MTFVEQRILVLYEKFEETDSIAELSDLNRDSRKYQAISECAAAIAGYDRRKAIGEVFICAAYGDLAWAQTKAAIDWGLECAAIARASVASGRVERTRQYPVSKSTLDAADHIMRTAPGRIGRFLAGRDRTQLVAIHRHLDSKWAKK